MPGENSTAPSAGPGRARGCWTPLRASTLAAASTARRSTRSPSDAGLTKGAVYDHFGSKEKLLLALLDEHLAVQIAEQIALFDPVKATAERPRAGADPRASVVRCRESRSTLTGAMASAVSSADADDGEVVVGAAEGGFRAPGAGAVHDRALMPSIASSTRLRSSPPV